MSILRLCPGLLLLVALLAPGDLHAAAAEPRLGFAPIASGPLAEINARDGDAMFNAEFSAQPDLTGAPLVNGLDPQVGATGPGQSARWSATLTPKRFGVYPLALRSVDAAVVKLGGQPLLRHDAAHSDFATCSIARVPLAVNKPDELVVEFLDPGGQGRLSSQNLLLVPPSSRGRPQVV
ncbi:MAG: hypothetical protein FJ399_05280 [Verrucomicrobia bacterium]|nr:hypothetical protein [Verrucomicrobiota bacterium]